MHTVLIRPTLHAMWWVTFMKRWGTLQIHVGQVTFPKNHLFRAKIFPILARRGEFFFWWDVTVFISLWNTWLQPKLFSSELSVTRDLKSRSYYYSNVKTQNLKWSGNKHILKYLILKPEIEFRCNCQRNVQLCSCE